MVVMEVLTIGALIGGSSLAVWIVKSRYQPEIERVWESRIKEKRSYFKPLEQPETMPVRKDIQ
jgi:hypothetical protein